MSSDIRDYPLRIKQWTPNDGYLRNAAMQASRNNLYELLFPFDNLGDQLDSEIMPLRVQWAQSAGESALDPNSESWKRFKELYSYQFQEEKTVALFAPELSFKGAGAPTEQYDYGRYLRIVYLYVKPEKIPEFEDFVHKFIVPAATEILHYRDKVVHAPPPGQRKLYRLPTHIRRVSINVNMPTIPEFELFIQRHLLPAAQRTNTALLTYRTVTGNKHNYHLFYPFNEGESIQRDGKNLVAASLLKEHHLKLVAEKYSEPRFVGAAYSPHGAAHGRAEEEKNAVDIANELAAQFHSHAIEIEEVVSRLRPDMAAALDGRFTSSSINFVNASFNKSI